MTPLRTILVPIDFSPGSIAAAQRAHELAAIFDSHVHLLHDALSASSADVHNNSRRLAGHGVGRNDVGSTR